VPDRSAAPDRPNVLFVHTDQQRWDALGAVTDDVHTPRLDRLAAEGVRFDRAFVQAPVCMPSRASYMTGRYPSELRIYRNGTPLPEDVPTAPEQFSGWGYHTASLGKLHFLPHADRDHSEPHPQYGFDHLELADEPGPYRDAYRAWVRERASEALSGISVGLPPAAEAYRDLMGGDGLVHPEERFPKRPVPFGADADLTHTAFVGSRTVEYVESRADAAEPFCCFAGFYSPHSPWVVPQRYLDEYDPDALTVPELPAELQRRREERLADPDVDPDDPATATFSPAERRGARHGYYAMVTEVDRWVGEILDALERTGQRGNTVVVFTSDHGEDLGDHLRYGKGYPAWDTVSRVPLIVSWPEGIDAPGRVEDGIVELVDLLPTLAEVCGLPVASSYRGESVAPALRDAGFEGRTAALTEAGAGKVLRTDRYRYCVGPDGEERLYDLDADPREHENLADDPDRADALADCRHRLVTRLTATDLDAARQREWAY